MTAAAASIDLKSLEAELARTKNCFDAWARSRMDEALQARDAHAQATQDQSAKLAGLRGRQTQLSVAAQQVKERAEREERETSSLRASVAAAQQEEQAVQQRASLLREQVQQQEQACTQLEEGSNLEEGIMKKKVNALKKALGLYSSRLGLEFRQSDEVLQLVFTQVDVARPSKQFVIGVHVHNGDTCTYKVTACAPALDSLPSLESRLNASNDFSEFVQSVRIAFKALSSGA